MGMLKSKLLPLCTQKPKTMSFRAKTTTTMEHDIFRVINSVYLETEGDPVETPESWFTNSSESVSTVTDLGELSTESHLEEIIRGAQQSMDHRLFFEPGGDTNSIVYGTDSPRILKSGENVRSVIPSKKKYSSSNKNNVRNLTPNKQKQRQCERVPAFSIPLKASVTIAMESENPYEDFKRSMEEMVESMGEGEGEWEELEKLLEWYLKANDKSNHVYIISAFVDLLASIVDNNNSNNKGNDVEHDKLSVTSFSSASSFLPLSPEEDSDHIISSH